MTRPAVMEVAPVDSHWMAHALMLAEQARGLTSPNPMVGAVLVRDGVPVGDGFHARAGAPHAEALALRVAGSRAEGATLYVTLEPCTHHGRTPPCVEGILAARVGRVVVAALDPDPRVNGRGLQALRAAGVPVVTGCMEDNALALNRVFFTAMRRLRPHVTLKCAMTLDGKIAAFDRSARWITGPEARAEGHRLRSEADAIVVGVGTALADDPALSVRLPAPWPREPLRVVLDSHARLPLSARLIGSGEPGRAVVAVTDLAPAGRAAALEARGATVLSCKARDGRVDPEDLCARLFARQVIGILLEGGGELNASFLEAGLVDRVAFFVAPIVIGGRAAPTAVGGRGRPLADAIRLESVSVRQLGRDWLIEGDVERPAGPT